MKEIQAVLFDCDGLMFDTERIAQEVWIREAEKTGIKLPDDFFVRITGASGPKEKEYLLSVVPDEERIRQINAKRYDLAFWSSFRKGELVKEGLEELYAFLRSEGYKIGVASSSSRIYVETLLNNTLSPFAYDAICTGDMVKHAKPDPEVFLKCAQLLNTLPEYCLVLEDSRQGILAAHRAGMRSVFIEDTIPMDSGMADRMTFRCDDLKEVIGILKKIREETCSG